MKNTFLLFSFLCCAAVLQAQDSLNMRRLARWHDPSLPERHSTLKVRYSGCWGMALKGREYAILGGTAHILFFDVTNPRNPQLINKSATKDTTLWREFKSYKNRIYAVSDNATEGLMIFDMSNAPAKIERTYASTEFLTRGHTIMIDTLNGRAYINGGSAGQGVIVLDIKTDPDKPALLAKIPNLEGGYIHDSYVRDNILYASSGYNGFWIYDFNIPATPKTLAHIVTSGYHHNNWLTSDGRYAFTTEEIPKGQPIRVVDLKNMQSGDIEVVKTFLDNMTPNAGAEAIPHNVYIKDNLLFDSQYEDGLLVYDIRNPLTPKLIAHYDTHPQNTAYNTYYGNWGNYPWLPSGTIIAGDMQNGLQLLQIVNMPTGLQTPTLDAALQVFPNPAQTQLRVHIAAANPQGAYSCRLIGLDGRFARAWPAQSGDVQVLDLGETPNGIYMLEVSDAEGRRRTEKVTVLR